MLYSKKSEIVKEYKDTFKNMFYTVASRFNVSVETKVILTTIKFLCWERKKLEIKQYAPIIPDPFYDGQYDTNRLLNAALLEQKGKAELFIKLYN